MRYSGIGGQAVMEGVMMRNGDTYAVAVRKPDQEIAVDVKKYKGPEKESVWRKIPIVRGVISFVDSLVLGMSTLMYSATFFEDEEEEEPPESRRERKKREKAEAKAALKKNSTAAGGKADVEVSGGNGEKEEAAGRKACGEKTSEKNEESTGLPENGPEEESHASDTLTPEEKEKKEKKEERQEKAFMTGTVTLSIVLAVAIFMVLPYYLSVLLQKVVSSQLVVSIFEGVMRLVIFILYIVLISQMKDIQRVFMYHGAEHKCINCIEHGLELNVENVRKSSREHKRCGTSFLLYVIIISIIVFLFIRMESRVMRLVVRLLLIPVIAGISYEFIRLAGRSDNRVVNALSKPGLLMQRLTTKEPDDGMIEVGIASVEAVFDWRKYQEEVRAEDPDAFEEKKRR